MDFWLANPVRQKQDPSPPIESDYVHAWWAMVQPFRQGPCNLLVILLSKARAGKACNYLSTDIVSQVMYKLQLPPFPAFGLSPNSPFIAVPLHVLQWWISSLRSLGAPITLGADGAAHTA